MGNQNTQHFDVEAERRKVWRDFAAAFELPTDKEKLDAMVAAFARDAYIKKREEPPPDNAIPTFADVVGYALKMNYAELAETISDATQLADFAPDAIGTCQTFQYALYMRFERPGSGRKREVWGIIERYVGEVIEQQGKGDDLIPGAFVLGLDDRLFSPEKIVLAICEVYKEAKENGYTGNFPFAGPIVAWQENSTALQVTREYDYTRPAGILKYPMGSIRDLSLVDAKVGIFKQFSGHGDTPSDYQMTLPGMEEETIIRPTQNFLVQEAEALTTKSGAVSQTVRIGLEAVMALPGSVTKQRVKFTLSDLIKFLNPDGKFHRPTQLKYIVSAFQCLNSNAVVEWEYKKGKTGFWLPVIARSFPGPDSGRDFPIVLDVELPPNATQGPMVLKYPLRMTGKKSLPQFNAYLAITEVWDRKGTYGGKITDPTNPVDYNNPDGQRVRNPKADKYPVFSDLDILLACFPNMDFSNMPPNRKSTYLGRAKKHFLALQKAGYMKIEETKLGWRPLPSRKHPQIYRALKRKKL